MKFGKNQFILLGLLAHVLAAFFSIGAHQCDEIYQVYEFAGYKLGINTATQLPWEFHEQMRSGIQPFIVYIITKALHGISIENPFTIALVARTLIALFSFFLLLKFLELVEKEMQTESYRNWLYGFGLLFWCLPYLHARFNSENFSSTFFLVALLLVLNNISKKPSLLYFLLAGIAAGIAFECRFQMSFMIMGFVLWLLLIRKIPFGFVSMFIVGILLSLGIGLVADHWLYNKWTFSWWNYLDLNLFKDKASDFGTEPIYFYITEALLQLIPPFSLVIIIFIIGFWLRFKTHVVTWITLPFIFMHFFVAHKELRFLFPVLNFLPFMMLLYFQSIQHSNNRFVTFIKSNFFIKFAITVNVLILVYYVFKPANNSATTWKKLYSLTDHKPLLMFYEETDPYSNQAALNYFKNPAITTRDITNDSIATVDNPEINLFTWKLDGPDILIRRNTVFVKYYSSFPHWFTLVNFNGWVDRSDPFTIYRKP